jgi:cell volume regulation protein A
VLSTGDQVLAVAARDEVGEVEDRLRAVSRYGRLARWYEAIEPTSSVAAFGVRSGAT